MWRAFSRSVCEVYERRVGFTAFRSDVSNRNSPDAAKSSKVTSHEHTPPLKTYCLLKHLRTLKFKQTSHKQTGESRQQRNRSHASNGHPFNVCLGTMGWSTALYISILSWYFSHHSLGRHFFGESHLKEIRLHPTRHYFNLKQTVHAQSPIQPQAILPLTYTSSIDEDASCSSSFQSSLTSSSGEEEELWTHQRGPFTPEEALDEVSRVFEATSRAFSGDVENKLGMICMAKGQHSKAMKHFRRASHHEHAVAAYNMGQCYELGLGTARNLRKAAKWYKVSSDRGHPTAMFNLAVFVANGWGGLCEDQNRARELLILAANLGLKEAKDALKNFDKDTYGPSPKEYDRNKNPTEEFLELIEASSRRITNIPSGSKHHPKRTYLSHLDWLDLSSSLSLSPSSNDIFDSKEERHSSSGFLSESDGSFSSSNPDKVIKVKNCGGRNMYFEVDSIEFSSAGSESLDEADTCREHKRDV